MKPVDKFGNPIFPKIFGRLRRYGEALEELGWKESSRKPNLFFKKFLDVVVFADMRGTEIVPIWEAPLPLVYASRHGDSWKRRRALRVAIRELDMRDIPSRLSFFDTSEPGGLFFGPEDELSDGSCKMCGEELDNDGLFCSKECEATFVQLKELRREEREQELKCAVCGKVLDFISQDTIRHHISYKPEKTIYVCRSCHRKIHARHKLYPNLSPKKPPDWKAKGGWDQS